MNPTEATPVRSRLTPGPLRRVGWLFAQIGALLLGLGGGLLGRAEDGETNGWWAVRPLARPPLPTPTSPGLTNPIDRFVRSTLDRTGLRPAPAADRPTLIRRLTFDLIGLPPAPGEIQAFLADPSPDAYERLADRLLDSPRHGERWARHWMDAVHFAETHGHDQDRIRTNAWPYRDYLIRSFNEDKPYPRFVQEQVAGDVLFPEEPQAVVAMGMLAAGPWDESSLRDIREDTLDRQIGRYLDRDDMVTTVMQTFTSTTVQCARCHDHKFDPISARDYYGLQAVFAGTDKANRAYDPDRAIHRRRQELLAQRKRVEQGDRAVLLEPATQEAVAAWEKARGQPPNWVVLRPETFLSAQGATLVREADGALFATGPRPERDTYTITAPVSLSRLTAIRLQVLDDDRLPHRGPGRQEENGNLHLSEFQAWLFAPRAEKPRPLALTAPTTDFEQDDWLVRHALDADEKTAWGIHPREGQPHEAVFPLAQPATLSPGSRLVILLKQLHGGGHLIGRCRLSVTDTLGSVGILPVEIGSILEQAPEARTGEQRTQLTAFALQDTIARDLAQLPPPAWVFAGASDFAPDGSHKPAPGPREIHVLRRGEITKPREVASPGALSCVPTVPDLFPAGELQTEGARRAALARWLTHPDNPLTWRSVVNRVWHLHFGRGLVATVNDFGQMGAAPSHPELLDWLAVWFRDEAQGSLKKLHRLIVTSATYRQSTTGSSVETDPDNRLLARMNRLRLDAEQMRDAMLLMSGRLDLRMGGPSDQQFDLKPGIHVTPKVDYTKFDVDDEAGRRRSVYRFLFRTLPDPLMEALDCPNGDQLAPMRQNSVTVQQALALWNGAFALRQAEHLATQLEGQTSQVPARIEALCEWTWGRPPGPEESRDLLQYAEAHGLANLCRLLLNSNEFAFVN